MTIKSTRAPRKTKVAGVIENGDVGASPKSDFRQYCEAFAPHIKSDCSTTRWAVALGAGIVAQIGSGTLVVSLISAFIALPTLGGIIWLLAFLAAFLAAFLISARIGDFVVKCIVSKYDVIALKAVSNLFNSKKVVTS
jgi:hypothetical protein